MTEQYIVQEKLDWPSKYDGARRFWGDDPDQPERAKRSLESAQRYIKRVAKVMKDHQGAYVYRIVKRTEQVFAGEQ